MLHDFGALIGPETEPLRRHFLGQLAHQILNILAQILFSDQLIAERDLGRCHH